MAKRLSSTEIIAQIPAARARAEAARRAGLRATSARYDRKCERLVLELTNGFLVGIPVAELPHLAHATAAQLAAVEVSPGGGAIRIDAVDADYSVPGLILSLAARERGARGGRVVSDVKAAAARKNGAKGGRPKRVAEATADAADRRSYVPRPKKDSLGLRETSAAAGPKEPRVAERRSAR